MRTAITKPASMALAALLLAACNPARVEPTATSVAGGEVTVVRVLDGDSILVEQAGQQIEVRLLGINAPEWSECHGDAAREALERLLDSGPVTLVADVEGNDQFGRLLRYVSVAGLNVNRALIANGDALALQGDHTLNPEFVQLGDAAAEQGLGMWAPSACGSNQPPPDVAISSYSYNPPGPDEDNLNDEWVAIVNSGTERIDLGGWVLRDESTQHRFRLPAGFVIQPGAEVFVRTGCGSNSASDLFWCADGPVWSNGGDTAILQLPDGTVVSRARYSGDF